MRKGNRKHDKERWRDIKLENRVIQAKLTRIQHEPPAVFHAPKSHTSLKPPSKSAEPQVPGSSTKPKAPPSTMPCHPYHVDVPPWPPRRSESFAISQQRHQRDVDKGNTLMFQKLAEVYGSRRPRSILNPGGVYQIDDHAPRASVDLEVAWAERTAFYLPSKTTHNNPLDPTYAHARYAAPDRPADRVLAALGILPGPQASPPNSQSGPLPTSPAARSQTPNSSSARARRARHALSAQRPPRPCDLDLSLELGGEAQAALLSSWQAGMKDSRREGSSELGSGKGTLHSQTSAIDGDPLMGNLGPVPGYAHPAAVRDESMVEGKEVSYSHMERVEPPGSPQAGFTPEASSQGPMCSASEEPMPCASPEPEDLPSDSDPPEGWPGGPKHGSGSTRAPSMSEPPPRHPKNPSKDSTMKGPSCRGYYASKGGCHSVPKSLGLAQCAGCGVRSFYMAGGVRLSPCARGCNQVFYCSETCARVDWPMHGPYCKWVTNGQWMQPGCRTSQQLWVANASLAAGRALLKKKAWSARSRESLARELDDEEQFEKVVQAARAREIAAEKKQAHVEYLAYHGMDGPRPCMYMGGKPI